MKRQMIVTNKIKKKNKFSEILFKERNNKKKNDAARPTKLLFIDEYQIQVLS